MEKRRCEDCEFFGPATEGQADCFRFPPGPARDGFPRVSAASFCGEWKAREEEVKKGKTRF